MIIRNTQEIREASEEIRLHVSFSVADVREWMESFYELIGLMTFEEADFSHYLKHSFLQFFAEKWQNGIAAWAWAVAVRHGFVIVTDSGYIVSARNVLKRSGGTPKGCIQGM
ncbi:MAG: hypothetical protein J6X21_03645 [Bacteroidaceae bacterium]|nr:hypothetical protein [Bacteroidaceae bacterium]